MIPQFKTIVHCLTSLYYIIVSVGQESGCSLGRYLTLRVSHMAGAEVISKLDLGRFTSKLIRMAVGWSHILAGC